MSSPTTATNRAFLVNDKWDDWGKFRTQFTLVFFDEKGVRKRIGEVKIGEQGLRPAGTAAPGERAPELPTSFDFLDDQFFSVGQNEAYYEALAELPEHLRVALLTGLRDCAFHLEIFEKNLHEEVMRESLLRDVREQSVRGRLRRLANGDARLTRFDFSFELPEGEGAPPVSLDFQVVPESTPPTNVHVIIGRNGVGKTHCMRQLTHALLGRPAPADTREGEIIKRSVGLDADWDFAGLVLVSFSAFDSFDLAPKKDDALPCQQVGLREHVDGTVQVKTAERLALDFAESLGKCREGLRASRWREAIEILETDDLFAEAEIQNLLEIRDSEEEWKAAAARRFGRLSSGHAIVLLTVTRLVELVDEKTLVLLDEPEGHLHPPLIAAFVRCLSTLLVRRNGVAIIATHSPVVLQEVPASSVWKLRRSSAELIAERPEIETFGENIGILTREVFAYQVTRAGFHKMLSTAVDAGDDFDEVLASFSGQLGGEARAIVRGLVAHVLGTINNCASGITPWGTYLTAEENFANYFSAGDNPSAHEKRWGLRKGGAGGYRWHEFDARFDAVKNPNEANRFGWIVEIDPANPSSTPVKRTALGRAAHEGATIAMTKDGHAVVYMGEDARFEYIYKFVSRDTMKPGGAGANSTLLDHGTLMVAKFNADGKGQWIALTHGQGPLTAANGFADQGEVLIKSRQASDLLGATKMDRPEWIDVDKQGWVYATLTNNSNRGADKQSAVDAANARANNTMGNIIRWKEDGDFNGTTFAWNQFVLAGDPSLERADAKGNIKGDMFACPDGLWTDARGVLWIQTDMSTSAMGKGDLKNMGNNMMLAADVRTGDIRRFLVGPSGCEITGATATPDGKTMFINIQHPGESPSERSDPKNPGAISNWPDKKPGGRPRSATVVIRKSDGGVIGT